MKRVRASSSLPRLSAQDRMFLRLESEAWPCHFGGLAVLEGRALLDASGELRFAEIVDRVDRRLANVPKLRRRVCFPGLLRGRPLWVDDDHFDVRDHVHQARVEPPGGDVEVLDAAARIYGNLLDRSRPLWELWFLTGLSEGRIGVLLKLHHAIADGMAAVSIMASLFDFEPDAPEPASVSWTPEPAPGAWSLLRDSWSNRIRAVGRAPATIVRLAGATRGFVRVARRGLDHTRIYRDFALGDRATAPPAWLNQPVRPGRRVRFLQLDLAAVKEAAHARRGKANDVVLDLWMGGLRHLMLSRGEGARGVEVMTGLPVSLRSGSDAAEIGNQTGTMVVPMPAWEADAGRRLDVIVARTARAKARQRPTAIMGFLVGLAATPIGKYFSIRQRSTNVLVTNVVGPPVPVYVLGARILRIVPIIQLVGNIGLTLCAFSYAGQMFLVVTADATSFPDLDAVMAGMKDDWAALQATGASSRVTVASGTG